MSKLEEALHFKPIFINPYTDFGFKRLFGEEANKDLLMDFLNQLLPQRHQIKDCTFESLENLPDTEDERKAIFDIRCLSTSGESFIIEMQKAKITYMQDRTLYYTTFPIRTQAQPGKWDFKLKPVYLVALLDFNYDEAMKYREIIRYVALTDQNGELFTDNLHFVFVQMPYFQKTEIELDTHLDKWLFFLKNLENFSEIPVILNEPVFLKAFETAKIAKMNIQEYTQYESSRLNYLEGISALENARYEGEQKGKIEQSEIVILNCIAQGISIATTSSLVGMSEEFIKEIFKTIQTKSVIIKNGVIP